MVVWYYIQFNDMNAPHLYLELRIFRCSIVWNVAAVVVIVLPIFLM